MSWQPIETAPKDGTEILASDGGTLWIVFWRPLPLGSYVDGVWRIKQFPGRDPVLNFVATHWQPLPQPPEDK